MHSSNCVTLCWWRFCICLFSCVSVFLPLFVFFCSLSLSVFFLSPPPLPLLSLSPLPHLSLHNCGMTFDSYSHKYCHCPGGEAAKGVAAGPGEGGGVQQVPDCGLPQAVLPVHACQVQGDWDILQLPSYIKLLHCHGFVIFKHKW